MNGIDKIISRISGDAQAEADGMLAQARSQAEEIVSRYQAQADQETRETLERGRRAAAQQGERLDSAAQMECRKAVLAAKQQVIGEAFDLALKKLRALPREDYVALLATLAAKASSTGREKLIFSPQDRSSVGKAVVLAANQQLGNGELTLSEECRNMEGGFILSSGSVEVNCTFETLLRVERPQLMGPVSAVLFP